MKKIVKKAQTGKAVDKTATTKPTIRKSMQEQPTYGNIEAANYMTGKKTATKADSTAYKEGFGFGRRGKDRLFGSTHNLAGSMEGQEKRPFKKPAMKSGGKVAKKGGMKAFEKTSFDKKADKPGGTHGKEGSAKDKKMDKIDAKKQGFIKKSGGKTKKK